MARLFERLQNIEAERNLDWIKVEAANTKSGKPKPRMAAAKRAPQKRKKK
jgi:hypothetical protein